MTNSDKPSARKLGKNLLTWYDSNLRRLPWRALPGQTADPYHVWLSEIMLQQTTVATVEPYFGNFVARWPTVEDLADSHLDEVLHAWQGLGYYARARNLHKCAKTVAEEHGGRFPDTEEALLKLPGVGPYTAAAIAAIAFNQPSVPVDGNIERVISRLHALEEPAKLIKDKIAKLAREMLPIDRPGDFAQAMMDLGATVCRPKSADCQNCPWQRGCVAASCGNWADYPVKLPRKDKPTRYGIAFWINRNDGAVFLRRRPEKGLLGGMIEVPSTEWREEPWSLEEAESNAPVPCEWTLLPGEVRHTFTHFHLVLKVASGAPEHGGPNDGLWSQPDAFSDHALPTVMKKTVRHALSNDI